MSPRVLRPDSKSRFVIFCDHASRDIPVELDNLGLPVSELARHIAWDIGAAGIAEALANIFDAPAVLSPVSRLVIDCNRHLSASDLIPEQSDGTAIPGNQNLSPAAKSQRIEGWFDPYHAAIESILIDRELRGCASIAISVHSMTDNLAGSPRPWPIAFSSDTDRPADRTLVQPMIDILRQSGVNVGDNEPYSMDPAQDFSIPSARCGGICLIYRSNFDRMKCVSRRVNSAGRRFSPVHFLKSSYCPRNTPKPIWPCRP